MTLVFLIFSGLVLRWPKTKRLHWHTWLSFHTAQKGRDFLANLHAVFGTWLFLAYLLAALTGLTWSYEWYRSGLTSLAGVNKSQAIKGKHKPAIQADKVGAISHVEPDIELVWTTFRAKVPHYQKLILLLPSTLMQTVQILYLDPSAAHPYANNRIVINGSNGMVEKHELYFDKTNGEKFMASLYALHSGHFFGLTGRLIMMLASLLLPFFVITGWIMYLQRRKARSNIQH